MTGLLYNSLDRTVASRAAGGANKMERRPQTLANHAKFDPMFHFVLIPVLIACFIASIVFLFHGVTAFRDLVRDLYARCISALLSRLAFTRSKCRTV